MFDKKLIEKVCNLTCTKTELADINVEKINYDTENPFKKYYSFAVIKGAIEKYISKKWDDQTLAHWAYLYDWILEGGFEENMVDNLDTFELFMKDVITEHLDGLSFFDAEYDEDDETNIYQWLQLFENYDRIWQTRKGWKAVFAIVGVCDEENESQYVALFNDTTKEYMIMHSNFLENGCSDECFKYVERKKFIKFVDLLKNKNYSLLSCLEKFYYQEIEG